MLPRGARICVALSGGKDSVALLHALHAVAPMLSLTLCAVHINHGIRGAEADRDQAFCHELCRELGIPFTVHRFDVPAIAEERGLGIEECAREVRYGVFDKLLESGDADKVATAHHGADSAETVLFNMARGTTIRGVRGIPPVRGGYIRPMINALPEDIVTYLRENDLHYMVDSTNDDINYTRNLIRAKIMPVMNEVNEGFLVHMRDLSLRAAEDSECLDLMAEKAKTDDISVLQTLHVSILKRVLVLLAADYAPATVHINAMTELVKKGQQGARVSLPGDAWAFIDRGHLRFRKVADPMDFRYEIRAGINKFCDIGCTVIVSEEALSEDSLNIYKKSIHTTIKHDKIKGVYIRPRMVGDSYRSLGLTRKVKKLLQSDKLTQKEREDMPVFCDGEGILWVPGHGVRDGAWDKDGLHIYYCTGVESDDT